MYSSGSKGSRGGGRSKSSGTFHPSPLQRAGSDPAGSERFRLVRGGEGELSYGMIIRLAPDLVEEMRRAEGEGGRIRFDANPNNPAANVINVGNKDFRFTWSHEPGDLCDIYEERKIGEDCNGTLVESGSAWRKLNVQRVLDESTKNHVKMRSEEAERKLKSRKAIVLDPGNPSMKNPMKALAAAETNPWKMSYKQKKAPPFKKRKPEPPIGGPPKSMYKSGLLTPPTKGRHSTSPLSSPLRQSGPPSSPFLNSNPNKGRPSMENIFGYEATKKHNSSEKDLPSKVKNSSGLETRGRKREVAKAPDLRSMLVSLLTENPSGMSFKALEKAVGEVFPNSVKQIEPIIKKIATYQAPGKYLLKPGVDMDPSKKPSPINGSSLLDNGNQSSPQAPAPGPDFSMRPDLNDVEEAQKIASTPEEPPNEFVNIDIDHESPDIFSEKRISDSEKRVSDSERPVASSSDSGSGSDSDSDSHDSGSHSKSPVGSGSSSDSESDASSNSKEVSDEDVDIMSSDNDDKEKNKELQSSAPGELKSPVEWKATDHDVDVVDIEKDLLEDDHADHPLEWKGNQENRTYAGGASSERGNGVEGNAFHHSGTVKSKSKRDLEDEKHHDIAPDRSKKLKTVNLNKPLIDRTDTSPTVDALHDPFADDVMHRTYNQGTTGKSTTEVQQPARKSTGLSARSKATTATERSGKHVEIVERSVHREKDNRERHDDGGLIKDKKVDDGGLIKDKKLVKSSRVTVVDKQIMPVDSHSKEQDMLGNSKDFVSVTSEHMENSFKEGNLNHVYRSPAENGRSLSRETPDMEVGELRDPITEDSPAYRKQFERKGSFKKSDNKPTSSEYWNSDVNKGKSSGKLSLDSRNTTTPKTSIPIYGIPEVSKRRSPETELNHSRLDGVDPTSQYNKLVEVNNGNRDSDAATGLGLASSVKQQDSRRAGIPPSSREKRKHQSNTSGNRPDKRKDPSRMENNNGGQKRRDASSDDNDSPYSKYEREEPDLKGPIYDTSQYEEYVKEYVEKYDSYMSLNKILEAYRNEFSQVAKDLEAAEGRDASRYNELVGQLHESYRQCGAKVKRLKKIFIVLHEELKCLKQMMKDFASSYAKD